MIGIERRDMIDQLGGRKFTGFLIISILLFVLVLVDKVAADAFVSFLTANFGIYVLGNVGRGLTSK